MLTVHVANILRWSSRKSLLCQWAGLFCVKLKIDVGIVGAPCMWSAFCNNHQWESLGCFKLKIGVVGAPCIQAHFCNDHRGRVYSFKMNEKAQIM